MYLYDGFRALGVFGFNPVLPVRIKEIQWPELDIGGGIDTTTMHNRTARTLAPKALLTIGKISMKVQYDPSIWGLFLNAALNATGIRAAGTGVNNVGIMGVPTTLVLTAPNTATLALYVFINKFAPDVFKEGEMPMADMEVLSTNVNPNAIVTGQDAHDVLPTPADGFLPGRVLA